MDFKVKYNYIFNLQTPKLMSSLTINAYGIHQTTHSFVYALQLFLLCLQWNRRL